MDRTKAKMTAEGMRTGLKSTFAKKLDGAAMRMKAKSEFGKKA